MKVVVDAAALADGSAYRGIGTYLRHVLAGVAALPDVDVTAVAPPGTAVPPGVALAPSTVRRLPARFASIEHDLLLPRDLARTAPDVVHSPAAHPPRRSPAPWVQTLHDLIPLARPDPRYAWETRRWRRYAPRFRRADAVVAVSRFSADQGVALLGLDPARVHVVPNGVDPAFSPGPSPAADDDPPYLLVVGGWGPHKGFGEACRVVAGVADAGRPHRLRLVGRQDAWMRARLAEEVAASPRPDRVDVVGFVDDVVAQYRGAAAVVVTSRFEGFGLPALEAMACGVPVVSFDNSSLPEVVGDAGVLVPDGDVPAMVHAVLELLGDPSAAADLGAAGVRRAAGFTWQRSVDGHADVLRSVARA